MSQRNFNVAAPKLDELEKICESECDEMAVNYFKGLNYELAGNEPMMVEFYEKLRIYSAIPDFVLSFHPYYRTAKFAQRASECSKAIYYYRKALEFYDGIKPSQRLSSIVSYIIYDIATVYLYMHNYEESERFIQISRQYDETPNQQRDFVYAILCAVSGNIDKCSEIISELNPIFSSNCKAVTAAIFNGNDPHYCIVSQDRTSYKKFWDSFSKDELTIKNLIINGNCNGACAIITQKLTNILPFMKRSLECRLEFNDDYVTINCKNYWVKTLIEEYSALFAMKPKNLSYWRFVSVNDFESY